MKTMQGIEYRRHAVAGAFARMAAYTLAFVLLVAAARVLVWPTLAGWIADATSVWIEVPADSVDLYRMLGYQEGSLVNGNPQFRDLADYRFVTGIIKGPVLWSAYAIGLAAVGLWCAARSTHGVDALMAALEQAAAAGSRSSRRIRWRPRCVRAPCRARAGAGACGNLCRGPQKRARGVSCS